MYIAVSLNTTTPDYSIRYISLVSVTADPSTGLSAMSHCECFKCCSWLSETGVYRRGFAWNLFTEWTNSV